MELQDHSNNLQFIIYNLQRRQPTRKRGFTLIELLVVIAIISILGTIGISVFNGIQKNSRDQQRLRDLNSIRNALEFTRSQNTSYPITLPTDSPKDPYTGNPYAYTCTNSCTSYTICAKKDSTNTYPLPTGCQNQLCGRNTPCGLGVTSQ